MSMRVFPVGSPHTWYADTHDAARGDTIHAAQDVFSSRYAPILAPEAGTVARVDISPRAGLFVQIRAAQPDGSTRRYHLAHLQESWVVPGQRVAAGEYVGALGDSGNAVRTRPHLHIGVTRWVDGRRLGAINVYDELAALQPATSVRDAEEPEAAGPPPVMRDSPPPSQWGQRDE